MIESSALLLAFHITISEKEHVGSRPSMEISPTTGVEFGLHETLVKIDSLLQGMARFFGGLENRRVRRGRIVVCLSLLVCLSFHRF